MTKVAVLELIETVLFNSDKRKKQLISLLYVNNFFNIKPTENVIHIADGTSFVCCGKEISLHAKSWKFSNHEKSKKM